MEKNFPHTDTPEQQDNERSEALARLLFEIENGRRSGEEKGWISAEEIRRRHLGEAVQDQ